MVGLLSKPCGLLAKRSGDRVPLILDSLKRALKNISFGKVATMRRRYTDGGTKNVAPRRSNFRKGTSETNQVRFVTVRFGRMLVR